MKGRDLRAARLGKRWSQVRAAARLGVSQPYLAMLERGQRPLTPKLALRVAQLYDLAPMAVPRSRREFPARVDAATLAKDLAGLGYPGLAYLRARAWRPKNPGEVLLTALAQDDLEPRLVEALPWLRRVIHRWPRPFRSMRTSFASAIDRSVARSSLAIRSGTTGHSRCGSRRTSARERAHCGGPNGIRSSDVFAPIPFSGLVTAQQPRP